MEIFESSHIPSGLEEVGLDPSTQVAGRARMSRCLRSTKGCNLDPKQSRLQGSMVLLRINTAHAHRETKISGRGSPVTFWAS